MFLPRARFKQHNSCKMSLFFSFFFHLCVVAMANKHNKIFHSAPSCAARAVSLTSKIIDSNWACFTNHQLNPCYWKCPSYWQPQNPLILFSKKIPPPTFLSKTLSLNAPPVCFATGCCPSSAKGSLPRQVAQRTTSRF